MRRLETARIVPAGDVPAPFSLHVILGPQPGGDVGPVPLSAAPDEGAARTYLAALMGDDDTLVELAALKVLANALPEALAQGAARPTNATLEERWNLERMRIRTLRSESPYFPRLLSPDLPSRPDGTLPPLVFDRGTRTFFVPPCPRCRGPLGTCTDESFLAERKLPAYAGTLERIVWCPACAEKGEDGGGLYSFAPLSRSGSVPVGSPDDLFKQLARALLREWDEEALATFGSPALRAEVAEQRRTRGTSPGELASRFSAFCFAPSPFLVTGLSPLRIDEWSDFVGGKAEADLVPPGAPDDLEGEVARLRLAFLRDTLPPTGRFFFGHDGSGLDAAEVLALKLTAFRQTVEAVLQYYKAVGQPHLDVNPGHVLLDSYGVGDTLPALWTFQVRLHGLASSSETKSWGVEAVVPPAEPLFPYAAPEILEFRLAGRRPGDVYVSSLEPVEGDREGRFRLEGRLVDQNGLFPRPDEPDWIHVTFPDEALGIGLSSLTVRRKLNRPATYEEIAFVSEPLALDEGAVRRVKKAAVGVRLPGARYKVFPRFGAPSDVYALGVVLLRTLVTGEGRELVPFIEALGRAAVAARRRKEGADVLSLLAQAAAHEPAMQGFFQRSYVFFRQEDRTPGRPNAIPPALWDRVVTLALRMVTRIDGFSYCATSGDFSPEDPTARLQEVLGDADRIVAELKGLLFHRQALHTELHAVLAELLEEEGAGTRE